jgi:prevent-host-death family protein
MWSNLVMKRVKISDLKAHLSQYINEVRDGETIIVCDRNRPVAELKTIDQTAARPRLELQRATRPMPPPSEFPFVELTPGPTPLEVLDELRRDKA